MGEDCRTFIPQMQFGWQSQNSRSFGAPLDVGKQNSISAAVNPGVGHVSRNETMPVYASSALPNLQLGHSNEPHGWFYCLPRFRQGFTHAPNFTAEEKLPADHVKGFGDKFVPYGESGSPQKQFLVIDQTAGQTTVYSSKFGSPNQCLASWHSKLHSANYLNGNYHPLGGDLNHVTLPTVADEVDENQGTGTDESEMHEDTEEINALLYSDSDDYSTENDDDDDDEVTSTGHSPSTMTTHDNQETFRGTAEEVASSAGNLKKRKLLDGYHNDIQFMDTAKLNKSFADDDDAESRCSSGNKGRSDEMGSFSASKKIRKEKIRDVLSALRSMLPEAKDKDPVMLLDNAISCLKSLKLKAKELGLNAL